MGQRSCRYAKPFCIGRFMAVFRGRLAGLRVIQVVWMRIYAQVIHEDYLQSAFV